MFTDLLEQKTSDPALTTHSDISPGKRGPEFDPESLKALNHLKEARLPAKYIGLDSTNIFEFALKWQKGMGLDPDENSSHAEYLLELSSEIARTLTEKITAAAQELEELGEESGGVVFQEVTQQSVYCCKKAATFMVGFEGGRFFFHDL